MNPVASIWYGVDPLAEKYQSIGGMVYCESNPIKYIDPNGMIKRPYFGREERLKSLFYIEIILILKIIQQY